MPGLSIRESVVNLLHKGIRRLIIFEFFEWIRFNHTTTFATVPCRYQCKAIAMPGIVGTSGFSYDGIVFLRSSAFGRRHFSTELVVDFIDYQFLNVGRGAKF